MKVRQVIGLLLMAACIAGLLAFNIHPPEGDDSNLLNKLVVTAVLGGGSFLAWKFLVRKRPISRD
ncbi:MAG TPA: hypothetical protein VJL82_10845 [Rhizomicrobium sp.]|nr:hypothetical protein [Rhizomicrobium sp.]